MSGKPRQARACLLLAVLALLAGAAAAAEPAPSVITLTLDGARRNILLLAPTAPPVAVVVMFPGGDGRIAVEADGAIERGGNFLIRTRAQWLARGFMFVAVDAADSGAAKGDRVGADSQRAIAEIVRVVRQRSAAPIWLVGTSAGAPAALEGAASLPAGAVRGVVVSSPVSVGGKRDSVFDVTLGRIAVPVLIQVHRDDACRLSPPGNAPALKAALSAAPVADLQVFDGGSRPRSGPCQASAQHGFLGIEAQVVDAAAAWIRAH